MGYRLNCLDETVFMALPKALLTEFGIDFILESCGLNLQKKEGIQNKTLVKSQSQRMCASP